MARFSRGRCEEACRLKVSLVELSLIPLKIQAQDTGWQIKNVFWHAVLLVFYKMQSGEVGNVYYPSLYLRSWKKSAVRQVYMVKSTTAELTDRFPINNDQFSESLHWHCDNRFHRTQRRWCCYWYCHRRCRRTVNYRCGYGLGSCLLQSRLYWLAHNNRLILDRWSMRWLLDSFDISSTYVLW